MNGENIQFKFKRLQIFVIIFFYHQLFETISQMENIPRFALGTWKSSKTAVSETVRYAVEEAGYRHVDCARLYDNEKEIGVALKDLLSRNVVKREDLWITSKLWNTDHSPDLVEEACRQTLENLNLEYLDLYLMHWPISFPHVDEFWPFDSSRKKVQLVDIPIIETWKAMEKLVEKKLVKRIGVSNFTIELLEKFLLSDIKILPYANQVEQHLFLQQEALIDFCTKHNIIVEGYRTLGGPIDSRKPNNPIVLENPVLNEIAKEIGKTPAQVELKFLLSLAKDNVVLAKSDNPERLKSNFDLNFELTEEQILKLKGQNRCIRLCEVVDRYGVDVFCDHW